MSASEQIISRNSYLPVAIPPEHFEFAFYGKVALRYWQDHTLVDLTSALLPAARELKPEELIDIAGRIEDDFGDSMEQTCGYYRPVWGRPTDLRLNTDGKITGSVGTPNDVIDYLTELEYGYRHGDDDILKDVVHAAAARYNGEAFAKYTSAMLEREVELRGERLG